jgi:aminoglycoside N3'-acetyltransferase
VTGKSISQQELVDQLRTLGVDAGGVLVVHTSFSKVGPVEGGPEGLIDALRAVLGREGTLVMPSMTDDDDHVFDAKATECIELGIVADTFWRIPGVLRSDSPHAFSAAGPKAALITADHPPDVPHGLDSPVGRVFEMDGQVLLLGVGHSENTTIHLAESMAGVRYRQPKHITVLEGGRPMRLDYGEIDHCCENFTMADGWLEDRGLQRRGTVGHAEARLVRSRDVVAVVTERLRKNETTFLHALGVDEQCDEARGSIPA